MNISIEELAETLKKLTPEEQQKLKSLLGEEWFSTNFISRTIQELLNKSIKEHENSESQNYENILKDSKEKYGL